MKYIFFVLVLLSVGVSGQDDFNRHFSTGSLRVDFIMAGDNDETEISLQHLKREPFWGGSRAYLVDTSGYGNYRYTVSDPSTGDIIFSNGFSTLFGEWQTTDEAKRSKRSFMQSVTFPFPLHPVKFEVHIRGENGFLSNIFSAMIDPGDKFIMTGAAAYKVSTIVSPGDPSRCIDIVFIPEGYTSKEMNKFTSDVKRLCDSLFRVEPYKTYRDRFNIHTVLAPSHGSGTDIPTEGKWVETIVNSSFSTLDIDRYLGTEDYWKLRDLASLAPYDQICVLVNTDKYGGGGIYNHYNMTSAGNRYSSDVFIHEFGHSFAGLGDEYYSSGVTYENFYPAGTEPWEPNLTTLVDFGRKWKNMIPPGVPVPTPAAEQYRNVTGLFEGGGYSPEGIYRPSMNCIMLSLKDRSFCEVCKVSVKNAIERLTQK